MARIIIDAGHGGSERAGNSSAYGARSPSGVVEKDVTLDIAKHVLARLGGAATLTRTGDRNLTLGARAAKAQQADVFVSIHANYGAPDLSGSEVYVHPEAGRASRALAGQITRALDRLDGRYGGSADERRGAMAVLNPSAIGARTAACLVEVDYLSSARGERRLGDPNERAAIGAAIAGAIQQHLATGLAWDLAEAIRTIDPEIDRTSLSSNQKHRLHDMLGILRNNPGANDHYLNGLDSELQRIGPRLTQPQFDIMIRNRVTQDLLQQQHWDTPPHIAESLRLLDERIWHGIQYLARRAATDGAATAAGLQQLKDWISDRQRDPNSIYYAYGDLQNRYQGGYGQQSVPNLPSPGALESGSLTLQPGMPGHVQVMLTNAHNGGNLCLEGTLTWSAGAGRPRTITARLTDLASQGFVGADHPVRQPSTSDFEVAIPLTGPGNEPLRWPVPINPGPARIELTMHSNDPQTRVRIDWRVVVVPPSVIQPAPVPLGGGYPRYGAALSLTGRNHGRVTINVPHVQPPDNRTLTFSGTADLRAGRGLRLGASLEDSRAPSSIPHVSYVDLDPYNRTPFTFSWPCRNLVTPGNYDVVLRVDGADENTRVEIEHSNTIGGGWYGQGTAEALVRPFPDPWIVPDPASYRGSFASMIAAWGAWFVDHAVWRMGVPNTALSTFPHCAIAELEIVRASGARGYGSGFYIGHEKPLTCGHNLLTNPGRDPATSIIVRLAKPSGMSVIGHTVAIPSATALVHPTFNASLDRDFDLAVVHTPGVSPPSGQYFPLPNMSPSQDQNIVVCAYSKFHSSPEPMSGQGQTIDGGTIVNATAEQYHFTIQGLPGSSGGPVFWPANHGMVVAVMTGPRFLGPGNTPPVSDYENRGVRLTPTKNAWIDSM